MEPSNTANVDVAFEILRYFTPAERCKYRCVNRAFNAAALQWWRRTAADVDVSLSVVQHRQRTRILNFLYFLATHSFSITKRLRNVPVDDDLLSELCSRKAGTLHRFFGTVETLEIRCCHIANYDLLAEFLLPFADSLQELTVGARYPMAEAQWNGDETMLCSALVQLKRLRSLHLRDMELKGEILTVLNLHLRQLIIERCPDVEDANLAVMCGWCAGLERLRLVDVELSFDTFRLLSSMRTLRNLDLVLNPCVFVTLDWILCICKSDSLEEALITGRLDGNLGEFLNECPWSLLISEAKSDCLAEKVDDDCSFFKLSLRNPAYDSD